MLGVLLYMRVQIASEARVFRTELIDKIEKAEALAKKIPRGCPDGVDAEAWNAEVEALRKKAADKLARRLPWIEVIISMNVRWNGSGTDSITS